MGKSHGRFITPNKHRKIHTFFPQLDTAGDGTRELAPAARSPRHRINTITNFKIPLTSIKLALLNTKQQTIPTNTKRNQGIGIWIFSKERRSPRPEIRPPSSLKNPNPSQQKPMLPHHRLHHFHYRRPIRLPLQPNLRTFPALMIISVLFSSQVSE